jgi:hypothetical protein
MIRTLSLRNVSKIKLDSIHYLKKFTPRPSLLRTLSTSASSKKKPEPEQEQGGSNNFLVWTVGALAAAGAGYYYQKGQLKSSTEPLDYQNVYNSIADLLTSDPDYDVCFLDLFAADLTPTYLQ